MAYSIVMLIIMCRRLTLSLHISGETYFILAFPHSEKTLHSLEQTTLKKHTKPYLKSDSTTNRKSNSYKSVKQKVLCWTSKGR